MRFGKPQRPITAQAGQREINQTDGILVNNYARSGQEALRASVNMSHMDILEKAKAAHRTRELLGANSALL